MKPFLRSSDSETESKASGGGGEVDCAEDRIGEGLNLVLRVWVESLGTVRWGLVGSAGGERREPAMEAIDD